MTFKRRLILIVMGLLILMLLANFFVSIYNARLYFGDQMSVLSQDASTSLGFAISTAAKEGDKAQIDSMLDVIFDSGYYLSASYINVDGDLVAKRERDIRIENVPAWFVDLIYVPTFEGRAEVTSGWYRLGEVRVVAHPGFAFRELWRLFIQQLQLFIISAVFAFVSLGLLIRALTKPLYRLEAQVQAITREDFVEESEIPSTREFRRVVLAVNNMARKIRSVFEQQMQLIENLRKDAHMDPLTELPNRSEFDARLSAWLSSEQGEGPAALMLISVWRLDKLNAQKGRESGDQLLEDVANVLKAYAAEHADMIIGRRSGADFSIYIPGIFPKEVPDFVAQVSADINDVLREPDWSMVKLAVGGAFALNANNAAQLLKGADQSLRENQTNHHLGLVNLDSKDQEYRSAREWLPVLEAAVESDDLVLFFQPAYWEDMSKPHHFEVLCRIRDGNTYCDAGVFWPLVERFGLNETVDRAVIERVLAVLERHKDIRLSLNLSAATLKQKAFREWLGQMFEKHSAETLRRLIIELPERVFRHVDTVVKPLIGIARRHAVEIAIDRFGLMATSMSYVNDLDIDIVKLDRRFINGIADSSENRFYVQTLNGICTTCEVFMFCEGVERTEDMDALKALAIKGYQGYLLGKPSPDLNETNRHR